MEQIIYHKPVLFNQSIENLVYNPHGIYVDCTFGGAGHSKGILEKLSPKGKLISFDQDSDALKNKIEDNRFLFIPHNFRLLKKYLRFYGFDKVDGIFADLGVSSHQFDVPERGFSTRFEGDLDMRMNNKQILSAKVIINEYSEEQIANLLFYYGDLTASRKMAKEIIKAREIKQIKTTKDLVDIFNYLPKAKINKILAQIFQAIRIEVNDELNALKEMLEQAKELLNQNGRLAIISYHSLEDRMVKKFLKTGLFEGEPERDIFGNWNKIFNVSPNKAIIPDSKEIDENPRSRSAKLRIGIKI